MSCREMKDSQFLPEKVSSKVAKELFERFQEYECIYQKVFAGTLAASLIPGSPVQIPTLCHLCCSSSCVNWVEWVSRCLSLSVTQLLLELFLLCQVKSDADETWCE